LVQIWEVCIITSQVEGESSRSLNHQCTKQPSYAGNCPVCTVTSAAAIAKLRHAQARAMEP
jgi:hypothetical protein